MAEPPAGNERFRPETLAGAGGMGEVWVAHDDQVGRSVALKVIRADLADDDAAIVAFTAEARLTGRLDHPGVVPVHALTSTADGLPAYAMKLVRGRTLSVYLAEARSVPDDVPALHRRLELFLKLCDALAYAHDQGVLHRDLKPDNVMVGDHGEVFVMDWGVAQEIGAAGGAGVPGAADRTAPFTGTPHYMSPEQARSEEALDARSDQYSLGLILFEIAALKPAMSGKDPLLVLARQASGRRDPLVHVSGAAVAPELVAIVGRACALDRGARYPDVTALADDVRRFLRGEAVVARPDTQWQATRRWVGHHRELAIAAVGSLLGMLVVTLLLAELALLRADQRAEEARQRLSDLQGRVAAEASRLDNRFAGLEGLLAAVAAATVDRLAIPTVPEGPVYWVDAGERPPGTELAPRYGAPVSFQHAAFFAPPGVDRDALEPVAHKLAALRRPLRRTLLASASDDAVALTAEGARQLLAVDGAPIAWASIGLENGLYLTFPGHSDLPADYDPRTRPWYRLAMGHRDPQWGAPYADASGLGVLLPCSVALTDEGDAFLGVASIKIPFEYLIASLLREGDVPTGATVSLLDERGLVVLSSDRSAKVTVSRELSRGEPLVPYPLPSVVLAVLEGRSGAVRADGDLVLFARMPSLGWTYALRGPEAMLVEGE
jgi:serine/threonine-protein kinase